MKKWLIIALILFLVLISVIVIAKNSSNVQVETTITEYTPEEEISEEQNRMALVTLYFINSTSGELEPEVRKIDVKELIDNPYEKIMNLLIEGPQTSGKEKIMSQDAQVNSVELSGSNLCVNLNKTFIDENDGDFEKIEKKVNAIISTFLELKEVGTVKVLVDGEEIENIIKN